MWRWVVVGVVVGLAAARAGVRGEGAWREDERWKSDANVTIEWKADWAQTYAFNKEKWRKELSGRDREQRWAYRMILLLEAEVARWPDAKERQIEAYTEIADHLRNLGYGRTSATYARKAVELAAGNVNLAANALNGMLRGADSWPVEPIEWGSRRLIALHRLGRLESTDWRLLGAYESLVQVQRREGKFMEAAATLEVYQKLGTGRADFVQQQEALLNEETGHVEEAIARWEERLADREDAGVRERIARLTEGQVLSVGRFAGNETVTLKWNALRLRPAEGAQEMLELGREDPGLVVPLDEERYTSVWRGVDRMIAQGGAEGVRAARGVTTPAGTGMAAYRTAPWSAAAQGILLEMGEAQLRAGHSGLARRCFEDVLERAADEAMRGQAQRGMALAAVIASRTATRPAAIGEVREFNVPAEMAWPAALMEGIPDEMRANVGEGGPAITRGEGRWMVGGPRWLACYGDDLGRPLWIQKGREGEGRSGLIQTRSDALITLPGDYRPMVSEGRVYARWGLDASGKCLTGVAAFDLASGVMIWSSVGSSAGDIWPAGDPVVAEGRVYYLGIGAASTASGAPTYLVCLDARDGSVVFRRRLADLAAGLTLHGERERERETARAVDVAHNGNAVTVRDGAVYVSTNMGVVARFDARDGVLEWARTYPRARVTVESRPIFQRIGSAPVVLGDRVIFAPRDAYGAFALEASSGKSLWERPFAVSREVVGTAGRVVVMRDEGHLVGIDGGSGELAWSRAEPNRAAVLRDGELIVERGSALIRLSAQTGATLEEKDRSGEPLRAFAAAEGLVVGVTQASLAEEKPAAAEPGERWHAAAASPRLYVPEATSPLAGRIIVESPGLLACLDAATGKVAWRRSVGAALVAVLWNGEHVLAVEPTRAACIDAKTGALTWETELEMGVDRAKMAGEMLIMADRDSRRGARFAAIDAQTGEEVWQRGNESDGERFGELWGLVPDGDAVHVLVRRGWDDPLEDTIWRAADGARLGSRYLTPGRGGPRLVAVNGLEGCAIKENRLLTWFTLSRAANQALRGQVDLTGAHLKEITGLELSGKWAAVQGEQERTGSVCLVLSRDEPDYRLQPENAGVVRGDRFYELADRTVTVIDLPSRREVGRFVAPVVSDLDHHTEVLDFWEEGESFFILSGMDRGATLKERTPGAVRLDAFDARSGGHRWGRELGAYWKAWSIATDREGRETERIAVSRQTQGVRAGGALLVSGENGVRAVAVEPRTPAVAERRTCYREGAAGTLQWTVRGEVEGRVGLSHDEENLYLSVAYPDDAVNPLLGRGEALGGDFLEVGLETNLGTFGLTAGVDAHGRGVLEKIGAAPLPNGAKAEVQHDLAKLEHLYRIIIPLRSIAWRGTQTWREMTVSLGAWEQRGGAPRRVMGLEQPVYLHPLNRQEEAAGMAIVDALPDLPAARSFFEQECRARSGSTSETIEWVTAYLKKHPDGPETDWAMEWLDQVLRNGPEDSGRAMKLAEEAGVSPAARDRFATVAGAYLSQWVYIDPAHPPRMLLIQLNDRTNWEHRVSWGEYDATSTGTTGTPSRRLIGRVPEGGKWTELRIPLIWIGMHDKPICGIRFGQVGGGRVYWDRTAVVAGGEETVLVEDAAPAGKAEGFWDWRSDQKQSGQRSHASIPPVAEDEAAWHGILDLKQPVSLDRGAEAAKQVDAQAALKVLQEQVPRLGPTDAAIDLFRAMVELDGAADAVARYQWFFRTMALHPRGAEVLHDLRAALAKTAGADEADRRVEGLIEQWKVPLRTRYAYRRNYVYPTRVYVKDWLVMGGFPNGDDRGLEVPYPPETERFRPEAEVAGANEALKWKAVRSPGDYVDLLGACSPNDQAVAYAVCWVFSEKARPAAIELGSDDGSKVWINRKVVHSVHRHDHAQRGEWRVPIFLTAGWNEVLLKVEQRSEDWGFYLELADPEGRGPLQGVTVSAVPPGR